MYVSREMVAALCSLLVACQMPAPAAAQLRAPSAADELKAKTAVKRVLKDPSSAVFEGLFTHPGAVCGFVNAKNSFGGYTGRRPFGYILERDVAYVLEPGTTTVAHSTVTRYCVR